MPAGSRRNSAGPRVRSCSGDRHTTGTNTDAMTAEPAMPPPSTRTTYPRHRELLTLFSDAEFAAMAASRGPLLIRIMVVTAWVMLAGAAALSIVLATLLVRDPNLPGDAVIVLAGLLALALASVMILVRHRRGKQRA
jgi:hypothetical protein